VARTPGPDEVKNGIAGAADAIVREDAAPSDGPAPSPPMRRARLTAFAVAGWLAVAGMVLAFVMPWAGLTCFIVAGLVAVVAVILDRDEARPERTADPKAR
jgi:hypothetical protein